MLKTGSLAVVFGLLIASPAWAQVPGQASAWSVPACDHACLIGFTHRYMDALVHRAPAKAPFAKGAMFTENDVAMPIGQGLWRTISGASDKGLEVADTSTGEAAWFGLVYEHGKPAYYAMRLKVEDGRISQVETVVVRQAGLPLPFGPVEKYTHDPAFAEVLPDDQKKPRERLRAVADSYFNTVELNDGTVFAPFDSDCGRTENGISTTAASGIGAANIAQGCEAQFKLGIYRINKRVRERRYFLIDEERGVVVATGFFDHANAFDSYQTTDGKTMKTALKWPNSISLMEAFKIRNGKIWRVEAIFTYVPYSMHNPWAQPPAAAPPPPSHVAASCNAACLDGLAGRFMDAMAGRTPQSLPWAKVNRYSENNVSMAVGDGAWATITSHGSTPLLASDPASGQVVWMGEIAEHGQPGFMALRLKVDGGRIAEAEAVIRRKGGPPQYGDPEAYAPAKDLASAKAAKPVAAKTLTAIVGGYFDAIQGKTTAAKFAPGCERFDNGVATTSGATADGGVEGCAAQIKARVFGPIERVRARRYPVVDTKRGIVVAAGLMDLPAVAAKPEAGKGLSWAADSPYSLGFISAFRIKDGAISRVETISNAQPYLTPSPWGGTK
jgi:hypothetical protein